MSKLSKEYPQADPVKWLNFDNSWQKDIDPIFAGRLAALARDMGVKININSGKRATEEQTRLYKQDGGYQDKSGNWVGGTGYVAVPGRSWHEFGEAIDTRDPWLKKLEKEASTSQQIVLKKYGLFKPLTKGNNCSVLEDWHIQPIETQGIPVAQRMAFLKAYKEAKPVQKPVDKITVKVNGNMLKMDVEPINIDGRVLVPVRAIAEALGCTVSWDDKNKTVLIMKG